MIRPMTEGDLNSVLAIERLSFSSPWTYDNFLYELRDNPFSSCYVYEEEGKILGYAMMWTLFEDGDITNIAVHPEYRKQGIAQKLLDTLFEEAKNAGLEYLHLEVRVSNEKALRLYKKNGFETLRIRKGYYSGTNEDAYEMWKAIGGDHDEDPGNRIELR